MIHFYFESWTATKSAHLLFKSQKNQQLFKDYIIKKETTWDDDDEKPENTSLLKVYSKEPVWRRTLVWSSPESSNRNILTKIKQTLMI